VHFYGVPLSSDHPLARQSLECKDAQGYRGTYAVDLSTAIPFQEVQLPAARGLLRPPLAGSSSDYSDLELIQMGYGLRPDANNSPRAHASWLAAATKPARPVMASYAARQLRNGQVGSLSSGNWTGPVFTPNFYVATFVEMGVPQIFPGGDAIASGAGSLWGGMGGTPIFGSDPSVLQDGVEWNATSTTASYDGWIEYFPLNDSPQFSVSPGDGILAEAWACDSSGNVNISGGYGCFFIEDTTSGSFRSCTSPTGSPCASIQAPSTFLGFTGEFIIEKKTTFMPDHSNGQIQVAETLDTGGTWETFPAFDYEVYTITGVHGGVIDFVNISGDGLTLDFNERENGD